MTAIVKAMTNNLAYIIETFYVTSISINKVGDLQFLLNETDLYRLK